MIPKHYLLYLFNFWPPFFGAGIKIDYVSPDLRLVRVRLKKRPWTANIVGIQYGGSIFSMADPFFMMILMENMGPKYFVMDKAASVLYLKPGRTTLFAEFKISPQEIDDLKAQVEREEKVDWRGTVDIKNAQGETVARVERVITVRKFKPATKVL